jgi:S-adenosylmethionine:tRNA ribosyltransferase-isomerase
VLDQLNPDTLHNLSLSEYDYTLPKERIAQVPLVDRDTSRLLVVDRPSGALTHRHFYDLPDMLEPGDVLVINSTKVNARRLFASRVDHPDERIETFLTHRISEGMWRALVRPGKKALPGVVLRYNDSLYGTIVERTDDRGGRTISFSRKVSGSEEDSKGLDDEIFLHGSAPLPPYIETPLPPGSDDRYQTVYSEQPGSAAAPTAGLHFTEGLLQRIEEIGVRIARVTLHIGLGTFRPIETEKISDHVIHSEYLTVDNDAVNIVNNCKGRVIAVGTTSARSLETAAVSDGEIAPYSGETSLYIMPGYKPRIIDGLVTNFHMPRTTLLVMVSTLAGHELIKRAYSEALNNDYRFLSFGDAMFICGIKAARSN